MLLIILLSLAIVATVIALVYLFNESRLQPDSPTIAAMEAHTEALEARRRAGMAYDEPTAAPRPQVEGFGPPETDESESYAPYEEEDEDVEDLPRLVELSDYEYREMLQEGGGNYVLPQWIANFFSSSDICHTLDESDDVILVVKMTDPNSVETGIFDVSVDCDMTTQTVALKLHIGEGAAAEGFKTKFYLFERGDLFELGRLVRQDQVRVDILTRGSDYTLDYACTIHITLPPTVLTQLKNVLANVSA